MTVSPARIAAAVTTGLFGTAAGALLMAYSEADDAPGGVLIGLLVILGAITVGIRMARPWSGGGTGQTTVSERVKLLESALEAEQHHSAELQSQVLELQQQVAFANALLGGARSAASAAKLEG